ncbi:hypothetical protein [Piscinibacter defluvii]|uniref:hypothetical protein n=1 Tax=Piscinibacter defluvii TaxID=1796922 RepID=UPI000FDD8C03|nr:hypothetical protein [Piscinibacter defluvii]
MRSPFFALALFCATASAQVPAVPNNVTSVQTVGYWRHGGQSGTYRVITTTEGWEHVWSRVFVEWLPEPVSREAEPGPSQSIELQPPITQGTHVIAATARRVRTGTIEIKLVAESNEPVRAERKVYHFLATEPGVVKGVSAAAR